MKDTRLRNTGKRQIKDFNLEELRGHMINRIYQIESKLNFIISDYYEPKNKSEFNSVLLNSAIISFGGKIKILANLDKFDNKVIDKIRKISSIRNAFAHLPISEEIHLQVTNDKNGQVENIEIAKMTSNITIMTPSGKLKTHNALELANEFKSLDLEISNYLASYIK